MLQLALAYFDIHARFPQLEELTTHHLQFFSLLRDQLLYAHVVVLSHAVHDPSVGVVEYVGRRDLLEFFWVPFKRRSPVFEHDRRK